MISDGGIMRKVLLVVLLFLLSGCSGVVGKQSTLIQVGEARDVKDCQLLESFMGPTSYRMWGTPYIGNFKNEAMEKAEKMGATHTFFTTEDSSIGSIAVLKAYKCPPDHDMVKQNTEEE
jgi:hypothetical protein